jgi:hypothetical protein
MYFGVWSSTKPPDSFITQSIEFQVFAVQALGSMDAAREHTWMYSLRA